MNSIVQPPSDGKGAESGNTSSEVVEAFYAGALEAIDKAWSAVQVMRYAADEPGFKGPDDFYHGVVRSRIEIAKLGHRYMTERDREVQP